MSDYRIRNLQICTKGINLTSLGCVLDRLKEDGVPVDELQAVESIAKELLGILRRANARINEDQPIRAHDRVKCPWCKKSGRDETLSQDGTICHHYACGYRKEVVGDDTSCVN